MSARIRIMMMGGALVGASLSGGPLGVSAAGPVTCDTVTPQETLTVAMDGDIETIDPMFSHFQKANEVNYNIDDQFFRYGTKPSEVTGTETYDPNADPGLGHRVVDDG